jgi:alpha-tubulin suppressor-like RCC1 family protein
MNSRQGVHIAFGLAFLYLIFLIMLPTKIWADLPAGVYTFGSGGSGQLGHGDGMSKALPTRIEGLDNVKSIAAGHDFTLVLLNSGEVYSFGRNVHGQLGLGHPESVGYTILSPTKIPGIGRARSIGAGRYHSFIILENGELYAFGLNDVWQLGLGDQKTRYVPTRVQGVSNVLTVTGAYHHSLVLLENGDVYGFGSHSSGTLGMGCIGGVGCTAQQYYQTPVKLPFQRAVSIAAGDSHSLVALSDGSVYSFGHTAYGKLGIVDPPGATTYMTPQRVPKLGPARAVAAGVLHSLVLLANGDLYSFGANSYGQLGLNDTTDRSFATRVGSLSQGNMITANWMHSLAILDNCGVYSFGYGWRSQLGHGDEDDRIVPTRIEGLSQGRAIEVAAGGGHNIVMIGTVSSGSLRVWIQPNGAVNAGAQWRRVGTTSWRNDWSIEHNVPAGDYQVEFKPVPGWRPPETINVTVGTNQLRTFTGTYLPATQPGVLMLLLDEEEPDPLKPPIGIGIP